MNTLPRTPGAGRAGRARVRPPPRDDALDDRVRRYGSFVDLPVGRPGAPLAGMPAVVVMSGLVLLDHGVGEQRSAEVLGEGDVFDVPVEHGPFLTELRSLLDARLYVLRRPVATLLGERPELGSRLMKACLARQHHRDRHQAALQMPRIEDRLLVVLALLAERFGAVTPVGVRLPVRLTHRELGWLAGARRPSVTSALSALAHGGGATVGGDGRLVVDPGAPLLLGLGILHAEGA